MKIRPLIEKDREDFIECLNTLKPTKLTDEEFYFAYHGRYMDSTTTLVAEENMQVIGTASFIIEKKFLGGYTKCCHIEDVAVKKNHQGKGVGKRLVEDILERASEQDCYKVILMCSNDNIPFYEKIGFKVQDNAMRFDI